MESEPTFVVASLNARIQPIERGEIFEDPLDEALSEGNLGHVIGGGTMQLKSGEIEYCDIEIEVEGPTQRVESLVIQTLESLGAPKGSKLIVVAEGREVAFGQNEGMAIYLNGTDLPEATYRECDSNFVYSELDRLLGDEGRVFSYWEGPTETAFYLYGRSFSTMLERVSELLRTYPLCSKCRVVQIA